MFLPFILQLQLQYCPSVKFSGKRKTTSIFILVMSYNSLCVNSQTLLRKDLQFSVLSCKTVAGFIVVFDMYKGN